MGLRIYTAKELAHVDEMIADINDPEVIAEILNRDYNVDPELIKFLSEIGGVEKLREFWEEGLKFDLLNGTRTTSYISEEAYQQRAAADPSKFDSPEVAKHGVKHRPSLTRSIVDAFTEVSRILKRNGMSAERATVYDLGCGEGKPVLIARSGQLGFTFKRAVGVDYFADVLDTANENARAMNLDGVEFVRANAAKYRDHFNGLNVIYMYNPFDIEIMREVAKNIKANAGTAIVCYNKPLHAECFSPKYGWKQQHEIGNKSNDPAEQDRHTLIFSRGLN